MIPYGRDPRIDSWRMSDPDPSHKPSTEEELLYAREALNIGWPRRDDEAHCSFCAADSAEA